MVKNISGGSKTKSRARKDINEEVNTNHIRLPECDLEKIAFVIKAFGSGRFEVQLESGDKIHCITRGKHKGKNRRNNMICIGGVILIGLREWENPYKTSDLITVYSPFEIEKLKTMNSVNLSGFPLEDINGVSTSTADSNLTFTNSAHYDTNDDFVIKMTQKIPQKDIDTRDENGEIKNDEIDIDDI